jgi:HlyD family secretion protein
MKMRKFIGWTTAATIVCGVAVVLVLHASRPERIDVVVVFPGYGDVANQVTTNGSVQPINEFQARANFPGMVEKVNVELGDKVKPGQLLVTMKDPFAVSRVTAANAAVESATEIDQDIRRGGSQEERILLAGDLAHAQLAQSDAAHKLEILVKLQERGAASPVEIASAQKQLKDADATLQTLQLRDTGRYSAGALGSAEAKLTDARASRDAAKVAFDNANIASPLVGTVYSVSVSPYDFVPMGADLLRVADLNQAQIRAYFDEPEVGKLKAGQLVTIVWDGKPGMTWHGHIKQAPVAAMPLGLRSVAECIIKVDDAKGDLLPNTNVIVTVTIDKHSHVLQLPRQALHTAGAADSVYRVVDGKLVQTPVEVGLVTLDHFEVVKGLSPNDVVAVASVNNHPLTNGLEVKTSR